jgi:hypothetical protein
MILIQQKYLEQWAADNHVRWLPNGESLANERVDTFLGLWSVSECTRAAHDYLIDEVDWFGASNVFLAMEPDKQIFPESTGLYDRLLGLDFQEEESYYDDSVYMRLVR